MQKEKAQKQLLKILQESAPNPVSGANLAAVLGVTSRTIRNYVKALTDTGYIITANKSGYLYEGGDVPDAAELDEDTLSILKNLLYENRQGISRVALAQHLHMSEATLDRRISALDSYLTPHRVHLNSAKNVVTLVGSESAKRHLIYVLLSKESQQDIFKTVMLPASQELALKRILSNVLASQHLHVDAGTFANILMHLSISIYRITRAHQLDSTLNATVNSKLEQSGALDIAHEVAQTIEKQLAIKMTQAEVINLALLLQDTLHKQEPAAEQLKNLIERRFYLLASVLLNSVDRNYGLDLSSNEASISRFALHIQNLYFRLQNTRRTDQPLNKALKKQFPFIYEIAVFVVSQLSSILEIPIPESEISFIAMHLGTMLMNGEPLAPIDMVLVDQNYLNSNQNILKKLQDQFADELVIQQVYQTYAELPSNSDYQHVMGTAEPAPDPHVLKISPFMNTDDMRHIKQRIESIQEQNQSDQLAHYIEQFLPESLLFRNQDFDSAEDCIHWLCQQMEAQGYVDNQFVDTVLQREQLSSTAFVPDIAMPHPLKPVTKQTTITILLNNKPMNWNGSFVRVVVLLGLSPNDQKAFQVIFDALINALSDSSVVHQLTSTASYDGVISIIKNSVAGQTE
jgi:lichenan operon transcriptional antiterminator